MPGRAYGGQHCSVAGALEVVGERWTFLIVRDALLGKARFDSFLSGLAIARNVLTDRLNTLVQNGIFERVPYQDRPVRHEYRLTAKGRELIPIIVSLMEWGDRYCADENGPQRVALHADCGGQVRSYLVCASCARPLPPDEVVTVSR
ncbi:MAG TPA: helix-turn-helix domain-containing protein [Micromonosporaceae bacterium]|nr:helix-turn-helix domain-containing protein [Micromonosporaceae bacterium]